VNGTLYANLVSGGNVLASVTVANNGTYGFPNLSSGNYTVQVSVNAGTVGQTMPATALSNPGIGWYRIEFSDADGGQACFRMGMSYLGGRHRC